MPRGSSTTISSLDIGFRYDAASKNGCFKLKRTLSGSRHHRRTPIFRANGVTRMEATHATSTVSFRRTCTAGEKGG
jgi:hypothetical protein